MAKLCAFHRIASDILANFRVATTRQSNGHIGRLGMYRNRSATESDKLCREGSVDP